MGVQLKGTLQLQDNLRTLYESYRFVESLGFEWKQTRENLKRILTKKIQEYISKKH